MKISAKDVENLLDDQQQQQPDKMDKDNEKASETKLNFVKTVPFFTLKDITVDPGAGHMSWAEVQDKLTLQKFQKVCNSLVILGQVSNTFSQFHLETEDDYLTALKLAEVGGEKLEIMLKPTTKPIVHQNSSDDVYMISGAKPKRKRMQADRIAMWMQSEDDINSVHNTEDEKTSPSSEPKEKISATPERLKGNISFAEKIFDSTEKMPAWFSSYMENFKSDFTKEVVDKVMCGIKEQGLTSPSDVNESSSSASNCYRNESKLVHCAVCDNCDEQIKGIRYKCSNCPDYDLCEKCEEMPNIHDSSHIFLKIKNPVNGCYARKGEDIFVTVDVDLPNGKCNIGDVKVVPKPYAEPASNKTPSSSNYNTKHRYAWNVPRYLNQKLKTGIAKMPQKESNKSVGEHSSNASELKSVHFNVPYHPNRERQSINRVRNAAHRAVFLGGMFLSDETIPDGTRMPPGLRFRKTWRVRNGGSKAWNSNTTIRYIWGNPELEPFMSIKEMHVPPLKSGEDGRITIRFTSPKASLPGLYQSHWRLHHKGIPFGQRLVCKVLVDPSISDIIQPGNNPQSLANVVDLQLPEMWSPERNPVMPNATLSSNQREPANVKHLEEALSAVHLNSTDKNKGILKTKVLKSYTATPANTPFDVSPRKSPDPIEVAPILEYNEPADTNEVAQNEAEQLINLEENTQSGGDPPLITTELLASAVAGANNSAACLDDESGSIFSLSSADSSDEFVVVPLPRCFDLSVPFNTEMIAKESSQEEKGIASASSFEIVDKIGTSGANSAAEEDKTQFKLTPSELEEFEVQGAQPQACQTVDQDTSTHGMQGTCDSLNRPHETVDPIFNKPDQAQPFPTKFDGPRHRVMFDSAKNSSKSDVGTDTTKKQGSPSTNPFHISTSSSFNAADENIIHVLPESIIGGMTGALGAAATVYNSVKDTFFRSRYDPYQFSWVQTSPPPAVIPHPDSYWNQTETQPKHVSNEAGASEGSRFATASQNPIFPQPGLSAHVRNVESNATSEASTRLPPQPQQSNLNEHTGMSQLFEMGFWNMPLNKSLLQKNNYNVEETVEDLLTQGSTDNNREQVVFQQPQHHRGFLEFD